MSRATLANRAPLPAGRALALRGARAPARGRRAGARCERALRVLRVPARGHCARDHHERERRDPTGRRVRRSPGPVPAAHPVPGHARAPGGSRLYGAFLLRAAADRARGASHEVPRPRAHAALQRDGVHGAGRRAVRTACAPCSRRFRERDLDVCFPIECRYVRADDVWLSMFEGRDGSRSRSTSSRTRTGGRTSARSSRSSGSSKAGRTGEAPLTGRARGWPSSTRAGAISSGAPGARPESAHGERISRHRSSARSGILRPPYFESTGGLHAPLPAHPLDRARDHRRPRHRRRRATTSAARPCPSTATTCSTSRKCAGSRARSQAPRPSP